MEQVKNNEFKKKLAIVLCFLVLMVCITGSTYAYFALTASSNNITGNVGGAGLSLTVTKKFPTANKNMIPQLESTLDRAISDEFSCIDGNGNMVCQVYQATVTNSSSVAAKVNGTIRFEGIDDMPNLKWKRIDGERTIGSYSSNTATTEPVIFDENKLFNAGTTENYYFVIWIDEIGRAQYDQGTFRAIIEFNSSDDGLTSTIKPDVPLLSDYIISLYNDGSSTTNATVGDGPQTVSLNGSQKLMKVNQGDTYGEEYRYYGASPNNYVDFNGELWRIISVSKVFSSETDTTGETRVRIIKDTKIGNYAWDNDDYTNNWADATLMCQLNTMYYNDTVPACTGKSLTSLNTSLNTEARSLIDNALWYLGGGNTSNLYADDYYTMERGTAVADSSYPYRWTGKVGLMYPSDYAYAADLSQCTKTGKNYNKDTTNCTGTDWLFNSDSQWLMSPYSGYSDCAWLVFVPGYVYGDDAVVEREGGVRPLAVLKSDVTKLEGEGTNGNPYKLGLGT